jgi:ABC-type amino acid transport substrate-binding protein
MGSCLGPNKTLNNKVIIGHTKPVSPFTDELYSLGTNIISQDLATGANVISKLNSNEVQIGVLGSTPLVLALLKNQDLQLVGVPMFFPKRLEIYSKEKLKDVKDFASKTIAVPYASTVHQQLLAYLHHLKIPIEKFKIIDLEPKEIVEAWNKGKIDAAVVWDPHPMNFIGAKYKQIYQLPKTMTPSFLGIIGHKSVDHKLLKRILSRIYKSNDHYNKGITKQQQDNGYNFVLKQNTYPGQVTVELKKQITNELKNIVNFLYDVKKISTKRDLTPQIRLEI